MLCPFFHYHISWNEVVKTKHIEIQRDTLLKWWRCTFQISYFVGWPVRWFCALIQNHTKRPSYQVSTKFWKFKLYKQIFFSCIDILTQFTGILLNIFFLSLTSSMKFCTKFNWNIQCQSTPRWFLSISEWVRTLFLRREKILIRII